MQDPYFLLFIQAQDLLRAESDADPAPLAPLPIDVVFFKFSLCHINSFFIRLRLCENSSRSKKPAAVTAKIHFIAGR
jgi:hypothetical protein